MLRQHPGWVEAVNGELVFASSPLVKCHSRPQRAPGGDQEPAEPAKPPSFAILRRLECLVTAAPTAVQRCLAGFFVLLAFASSRTADLLRTRPLAFTRPSLSGESIMLTEGNLGTLVCPPPMPHI